MAKKLSKMDKRIISIMKGIGKASGSGRAVSDRIKQKGYKSRKAMFEAAKERDIKKNYPAGLSTSATGMEIRNYRGAELKKKLTSKNPRLLKR